MWADFLGKFKILIVLKDNLQASVHSSSPSPLQQ
jgi:hypothetical protein